jgi:tetratricopeptide (TPR) repeat protein
VAARPDRVRDKPVGREPMSSKRTALLMGILLVLVMVFVARPLWEPLLRPATVPLDEPVLQSKNKVAGLQVRQEADGRWMASFAYEYSGPAGALLKIELLRASAASAPSAALFSAVKPAERGSHRLDMEIARPVDPVLAFTTAHVDVHLRNIDRILARQRADQTIDWPAFSEWAEARALRGKTSTEVVNDAVGMIDRGDRTSLAEAKRNLERLIARDAKADAAYIELARIAMKTNWGPEGLHQAETLLASALQIRPDSVNAKILLGYVFAHQGRYKPSEALFVEASGTDTKNLWLWANWGEVLVMQGKLDQAERKYREAVTRPRTHDTYDRARLDAYARLLALLEQRRNIDGMEALHKQRAQEFGPGSCYTAEHARFVLQQRGDAAEAILLARQVVDSGGCPGTHGRQVLGLAHYVAWSSSGAGPQREESLHQARVFFPSGPELLYQLASSERTSAAAGQLKKGGEPIDQFDNRGFNALSYALERNDLAAARRLLRLGARTDTPVGPEKVPVALLPVIAGNLDGIRVMQQSGVDYSKLRYQGMTAIDHAKRIGDRRLLEALDKSGQSS